MDEDKMVVAGRILAMAFALAVVRAMVDTARELDNLHSDPETEGTEEVEHDPW